MPATAVSNEKSMGIYFYKIVISNKQFHYCSTIFLRQDEAKNGCFC
jgi:hypothetical protein